jgi:hypothetical protein
MLETKMHARFKMIMKGTSVKLYRIENSVGRSIPDILFFSPLSIGFIEYKRIDNFKFTKDLIKIPFRPGQYEWINKFRNITSIGSIFLMLTLDNTFYIYKNLMIQRTYTKETLISKACFISLSKNLRENRLILANIFGDRLTE